MAQTISRETQGEGSPYFGKRAVILTRVSTPKQEEMYGHTWQEMQIRNLLIEPLGLQLDEERHIIRDTYSGLEYRYREALARILEMAERGEFDLLVMEVLDRGLGRKALAREIFRMQLRELGIRVLTTDPNDHADDDSLVGQVIRFLNGYKAEGEITDFVRRSRGGKRAKATGDKEKGVLPRIVGNGQRIYGYKYILSEKGKRIGFETNLDVILVDEDGTEWTEVTVVIFIFESAARGMSQNEIAKALNEKGIPSPYAAKGLKRKGMTGKPVWIVSTISKILKQSAYYGEYRQFRTANLFGESTPGKKETPRRKTSEEEQVVLSVPAIITKELSVAAQISIKRNQDVSSRNNPNPYEVLLRAGLIKCGHCGGNMTAHRHYYNYQRKRPQRQNSREYYIDYQCQRRYKSFGRCDGCQITAPFADNAAWQEAVKIIRNPSLFENKIQKLSTSDPIIEQRKRMLKTLVEIRNKQTSLRKDFSEMSQAGKLDKGTREYLTGELNILAKREEDAKKQLADEQAFQVKYNLLQKRIATFHERCQEWREKLDDPEFIPPYEFKREACEFFGITAIVYRDGLPDRCAIETRPPSIMSLLSSSAAVVRS